MDARARDQYLTTEIMTATPQKLHLVLIEAAIRAIHRGRHYRRAGENDKACVALVQAQKIIGEVMAGFRREVDPGLVTNVASVYMFVFRCLVDGNLRHDERKLDDALRVLEIERGTWQAVCQQLTNSAASQHRTDPAAEFTASRGVPPPSRPQGPHLPSLPAADILPSSGFSMDA
jgi:flagellar protein FliS